jgi:hypothetical protein
VEKFDHYFSLLPIEEIDISKIPILKLGLSESLQLQQQLHWQLLTLTSGHAWIKTWQDSLFQDKWISNHQEKPSF